MLCCHCKKNQATKTFERNTDGKKQTEYYCPECYNRLFISMEENFSEVGAREGRAEACPFCGTTEEEFLARGRVGCAECYRSLGRVVLLSVIRMQGAEAHCGKRPNRRAGREELIRRRNYLKTRVEELMAAKTPDGESRNEATKYSRELSRLNKILYKEENDE